MSDQEQTKLMVQTLVSKFDEHCEYTKKELGEIKRGVYGDPANRVLGLIDRQLDDERRIKAIEAELEAQRVKKKTLVWIGAGVLAALQAIFTIVYEVLFGK